MPSVTVGNTHYFTVSACCGPPTHNTSPADPSYFDPQVRKHRYPNHWQLFVKDEGKTLRSVNVVYPENVRPFLQSSGQQLVRKGNTFWSSEVQSVWPFTVELVLTTHQGSQESVSWSLDFYKAAHEKQKCVELPGPHKEEQLLHAPAVDSLPLHRKRLQKGESSPPPPRSPAVLSPLALCNKQRAALPCRTPPKKSCGRAASVAPTESENIDRLGAEVVSAKRVERMVSKYGVAKAGPDWLSYADQRDGTPPAKRQASGSPIQQPVRRGRRAVPRPGHCGGCWP